MACIHLHTAMKGITLIRDSVYILFKVETSQIKEIPS